MRLLITGGAGFIGSALVRQALRTGHRVVTVDALTYAATRDSLAEVEDHPEHSFLETNIRDRAAMDAALTAHRPQAILNLAAESHVDRSIDDPTPFVETNVTGTFTLLEAARAYWAGLGRSAEFRFLQVSTDEVYGSLDGEGTFTESSPYAPRSPYSASKAGGDHLVQAWAETYGLPVMISHGSNTYGPRQFPEKLIPVVIMAALAGRPIPVYGQGENRREWLYVEDHAEALLLLAQKGRAGRRYNIGGGQEARNIDLVRQICAILDELRPGPAPYAEQIRFVTDRPGHDLRYALDTTRLRQELSWQPRVALDEGLKRTVGWYLDNTGWWQALLGRDGVGERLGAG